MNYEDFLKKKIKLAQKSGVRLSVDNINPALKPHNKYKSAVDLIPEMQWAKDKIKCDADIRSMCSAGFAEAFFLNNR